MGTILVIGASGQLAQSLLEIAPEKVSLAGRAVIDLSDTGGLDAAIAAHAPSAVINAAAYTAVDKAESDAEAAFALNRDGPAGLARICAAGNIPLVHVSTDYVFDGSKDGVYWESDPKSPLGVYGRSKSDGEDAVLAAGGAAAIVRTSWVYSAIGGNFVKTMLRLAREGRAEVGVVADQHGRPTYAPDLAQACLAALAKLSADGAKAGGVYHFAGADDAVWADLAEATFAGAAARGGPAAAVKRITTAEYPTPAKRPANSRLDCTQFVAQFGFAPKPWRQSLEDCLDRLLGARTLV